MFARQKKLLEKRLFYAGVRHLIRGRSCITAKKECNAFLQIVYYETARALSIWNISRKSKLDFHFNPSKHGAILENYSLEFIVEIFSFIFNRIKAKSQRKFFLSGGFKQKDQPKETIVFFFEESRPDDIFKIDEFPLIDDILTRRDETTADCICGKESHFWCGRCKNHRYCEKKCQKKDWNRHKLECEVDGQYFFICSNIEE